MRQTHRVFAKKKMLSVYWQTELISTGKMSEIRRFSFSWFFFQNVISTLFPCNNIHVPWHARVLELNLILGIGSFISFGAFPLFVCASHRSRRRLKSLNLLMSQQPVYSKFSSESRGNRLLGQILRWHRVLRYFITGIRKFSYCSILEKSCLRLTCTVRMNWNCFETGVCTALYLSFVSNQLLIWTSDLSRVSSLVLKCNWKHSKHSFFPSDSVYFQMKLVY